MRRRREGNCVNRVAEEGKPKMEGKPMAEKMKKRKSGIPTGNAGEYFVMGELLRRGFDAQLADRNTKGYDILVRSTGDSFRSVQVKTVRTQPWYVNDVEGFKKGDRRNQITVYVLIGKLDGAKPVRFFIVKNNEVAKHVHTPNNWTNGFISMNAVLKYEDRWDSLRT